MASSIDASTSGAGGVITTADNTGILQLKTAGTTAVTVDASQNVGIGTTSPSYRLDLFGTNCSLQIRDIGQTNGLLLKQNNSDGGNLIYATNNNYLALGTNNTERMRIDSSGNFSAVIPSGSTSYPAFWCRAWVNFNGTGTVAIRASGNVTSITDNGTGEYTINFTTAMPDANYATVLGGNWSGTAAITSIAAASPTYSTSAVKVQIVDRNGTAQDISIVSAAIIR